ncbi:unnamed protein product [Allacma fusca]|uniref:Uncharacterized protein n=1 Tax=Allacma fusca TaxID=39272 RepID=A0A8J2PVF1_9HEXA|nr:unnamed protein product [Allacma fusca]
MRGEAAQCELNSALKTFWKVAEISGERMMSAEERACDEHYASTTTRNLDGSYTVKLPFNENPTLALGDSRHIAMHRYHSVERRLIDYFRILWRFDKSRPVKEYTAKTVLYWTASATCHAVKPLHKLANDSEDTYPLAASKITKDRISMSTIHCQEHLQ